MGKINRMPAAAVLFQSVDVVMEDGEVGEEGCGGSLCELTTPLGARIANLKLINR